MSDAIDKSKAKQPNKSQPSYPIDIIVPQQLEECVVRLSNVTKLDSGEFRFQMQPKEDVDLRVVEVTTPYARYVRIKAELYLTRWQGTSTRIQGNLHYTAMRSSLYEFKGSQIIGAIIFTVVLFLIIDRYAPSQGFLILALVVGIFIIVLLLDHVSVVRTDDFCRHLERVLQSVLST